MSRISAFGASTPSDLAASALNSAIPEGERVYAIGDIHGRLDLLTATLDKIDAHLAAHPIETPHEVFLGDYIDRGPRSREVIDTVMARAQRPNVVALSGNHEEIILRASSEPDVFADWMGYGGREALLSYGIHVPANFRRRDIETAMTQMREKIPAEHFAFFEGLPAMRLIGDYVFVHAGLAAARRTRQADPPRRHVDQAGVPLLPRRLSAQGGAWTYAGHAARSPGQPDQYRHRRLCHREPDLRRPRRRAAAGFL